MLVQAVRHEVLAKGPAGITSLCYDRQKCVVPPGHWKPVPVLRLVTDLGPEFKKNIC